MMKKDRVGFGLVLALVLVLGLLAGAFGQTWQTVGDQGDTTRVWAPIQIITGSDTFYVSQDSLEAWLQRGDWTFTGTIVLPDSVIGAAGKIKANIIDSQHYAAGSVDAEHLAAGSVDSTHIKPNSVHESEMNWAKQNIDSVTSRVKASRIDSSYNFLTFVATNGDTNSIRAKTDGTLNLYSNKGIGLRMPKSDATYIFSVGNDISGVDSTWTMDSAGRNGIKGAPNASYSLYLNSGALGIYQASPTANQTLFQIGTSDDANRFSVDEDGDVAMDGTLTANSINNGYITLFSTSAYRSTTNNGSIVFNTTGMDIKSGTTTGNLINLSIESATGVDPQIRFGRTSTSGSYTVTDSMGRMAVSKDATHPHFGIDVDDGVRCSDTLYVGDYTNYTYIIPGGDPVKSSDADLKHNFTPLDSLLKPWELFGKAEGLEIYRFQYDSAKVYAKAKFDSTVFSWWNEKPADSLSLGQKDSVSAELAKRKADTKKNWENERKEFASKVSRPTHTGPTEADWGLFMYSDNKRKGINSGDVMWAQMSLIKKLIAEVKRQDVLLKDLEARVSKLEGN